MRPPKRTDIAEPATVLNLDQAAKANVLHRQAIIKDIFIARASTPPDQAAVALICFGLTIRGEIRTTCVNIEPEQAPVLLSAVESMAERLREFISATKADSGNVIDFPSRP
jgi:hypothetical protein